MSTATPQRPAPGRAWWPHWSWFALVAPWCWFLLRDRLGAVALGVAILMPVLVPLAAAALVVLVRPRRVAAAVAASTLLAGVVAVVLPWTPQDAGAVAAGRAVTVASANVRGRATAAGALVAADADVLVISEMAPGLRAPLAAHYPYRAETAAGPDVAVFSRLPLEAPRTGDLPGLRVEVAGRGGPFVLYALHVPRPWITGASEGYQATPDEHLRIVEGIRDRAAAERSPVVVTGDLNSSDRAPDYRALVRGGLVDAMRAEWAGPTQVGRWRPLLVRIDHVLVGPGWCGDGARRLDLPRSDHAGVTVAVGPCVRG